MEYVLLLGFVTVLGVAYAGLLLPALCAAAVKISGGVVLLDVINRGL